LKTLLLLTFCEPSRFIFTQIESIAKRIVILIPEVEDVILRKQRFEWLKTFKLAKEINVLEGGGEFSLQS
jgi:hypothetical protein